MRRTAKLRSRATAGVALVEFAVVVPLLAGLLVGAIEVGRFAYYSIAVANAANAGAQYGAQNAATAAQTVAIQNAAIADGQNNIQSITAVASVVCSCWNRTTGTESPAPPTAAGCAPCTNGGYRVTYVQVQTSGSYPAMFRYPALPTTFSVGATAIRRVRQQ